MAKNNRTAYVLICGFFLLGNPIWIHSETAKTSGFPQGLHPGESIQEVENSLTAKGLKKLHTSNPSGGPTMVIWGLSGQVSYKDFKPSLLNAEFRQDKLSSIMLESAKFTSCSDVIKSYQSASEYVKTHYSTADSKIKESPSSSGSNCNDAAGNLRRFVLLMTKDYMYSVEGTGPEGSFNVHIYFRAMGPAGI
jgi:hypothetical protein